MKKWPVIIIVLFILAAVVSVSLKKSGGEKCALDGLRIEPIYQVDIATSDGETQKFCCIDCARKWLAANKGKISAVTVTDEITGKKVDASIAWFVESSVVTNPSTGNRIHVFAEKEDAARHAREFGGTVIDNPLAPAD